MSIVAEAFGVKFNNIVEDYNVIYADEPFDIATGHVAAGMISGMRFEIKVT